MGFQFIPGGLISEHSLAQNLAQRQYAEASLPESKVTKNLDTQSDKKAAWMGIRFTLPKVDFGLDALYGLDQTTDDSDSEDFQF